MRKKCSQKEDTGKEERKRKKRGEMGCQVGNRNDEERGTHFCFFPNITEVTLGNSQKK